VTNKFEWDQNGKALRPLEPIIHSLNKDETVLKEIPSVFEKIKNRPNVILLGDSLGDPGMVKGFYYKNMISLGFLNIENTAMKKAFDENFDVVLTGDGNFQFVNELMRKVINH